MSVSGDSAEQVVRLSLEGFEVIAKLTGSGEEVSTTALAYQGFFIALPPSWCLKCLAF